MDPQTFYIKTYGCQMNELDSAIMSSLLEQRGMEKSDEENADLIIFNTCSVRDLAERKVFGKLGILGRKKKSSIIGVAGCIAMHKKEAILQKFPHVDFVLGTNNIADLPQILDEVLEHKKQAIRIEDRYDQRIDHLTPTWTAPIKAFVSIIRGCNKFCTYCIVPFTRGREISRPPHLILEECKILADKGCKEITLLGQNVNSYGKDLDNMSFSDLLSDLDKIEGIQRIRFLTSHPVDISKDLMYAVRDLPSVCEFIHFPIQSGSNHILKKMNRRYTAEEYMEKIALFREIVPGVSFGTDIIVGFPGETEEDFLQTCQLFHAANFSLAYIFAYSPRKGTAASLMKDDVPFLEKKRRLEQLLTLYKNNLEARSVELIGKRVEVLVERENKDHQLLKGKTRGYQKVIFPGQETLIGSLCQVQLEEYKHQTFLGKIIPKDE
ncbi:MAG: tRNA (N6-isopentenyl adenosine(37)-C2)-methylthiotransferase MiaB [Parachlamydiales bacterium]|nr:tRNA (N6-isopentenyl adenosine(37)-C2)-methylthiotransferase MiaB [Parachlamydiales bacterium]